MGDHFADIDKQPARFRGGRAAKLEHTLSDNPMGLCGQVLINVVLEDVFGWVGRAMGVKLVRTHSDAIHLSQCVCIGTVKVAFVIYCY